MPQSILYKTLTRALTYKRPHDTKSVIKFTQWLENNVPAHLKDSCYYDAVGNLHIDARTSDDNRTLFVAHVDTVHRSEGKNFIRKDNTYWYADGDVLGADDGAGCALLMHLMHAGIAAYYVFTQGEERGGIGAKFLFDTQDYMLQQFDKAIAFDRRGIESVITHQGWGRCCSDDFGNALCAALGAHNSELMHLTDDTGVYTDTAEFVDVIPECTNISVGYYHEHTQQEKLNIVYFDQLAHAIVNMDWDALPVKRDPSVREDKHNTYGMYSTVSTSSSNKNWRDTFSTGADWEWVYEDEGYGYTHDPAVEELHDALVNAKYGYTGELAMLIARCAYPEDPALCIRHMDMRHIDLRSIDYALQDLHYVDPDTILLELFDEAHVA